MEAIVNNEKMTFLLDTGAEMSLISSSIPGLEVRKFQVSPVSITTSLLL